ncbi:ABC transporter ATP-binding protein [Pseudonocardia pini]|uniref:ABC transporter ATP-binding protein n=1 Tax=Pseudonocardia pini TaxID=2758030 RepID=UPI0015F056A5|nr:ABC transporter ATP-binding protein [Pseudonocardia pini]
MSAPAPLTETPAPAPAVRTRGLGKTFGAGDRAVAALRDIDLDITRGEFVTILGPSGCGKTTLLRILAGLADATAGEVSLFDDAGAGTGVGQATADGRISFVFQEPNLMPWRTVRRNVELPLEVRKVPAAQRRARATDLLDMVGLGQFHDAYPRELSGGMKQRVAIARALSYRPELLMMDEPFGALDAQTRDHMNAELQRIWMESGTTALLVTHHIPEAVFLADRVVVLTGRPGGIREIVDVDLPRPRPLSLLEDPDFVSRVARVRTLLGDR